LSRSPRAVTETTGGSSMASNPAQPPPEATADDPIVVHFTGGPVSLDEETLHRVRGQLLALVEEPTASDLLLDFANVQLVSSMALATLVGMHTQLVARGRRLTLFNLSPFVREVFAVTRLDQLLDLGAEDDAERPAAWCPDGSAPGVLVVDDETAVLCVLAARFRHEGVKVWLAGHGPQAIELYRSHRGAIDVVLLDVLMPGMDGPRTL